MLLKISFSIFIIVMVLHYIDDEKVVMLLSSVDLEWFAYLIVLITIDRLFMAYKWSMLLEAKGIKVPIVKLLKLYYVGTFVGVFLPTTVGGDMLRVYLLSNEVERAEDVFSSVVVERLVGFLAALILAFVSIAIFEYMYVSYHKSIFYLVLGFAVFFSVTVPISLKWGLVKKIFNIVPGRFQRSKAFIKLKGIYVSYVGYSDQKSVLIKFLVFSLLEQIFPVAEYYVSARAIGVVAPVIVFFAVVPIVMLIVRIPISFNGIGVNEGLLVYFFSLLGLSLAGAFSIGLLGHIGVLVASLPGLLVYVCSVKSRFLARSGESG